MILAKYLTLRLTDFMNDTFLRLNVLDKMMKIFAHMLCSFKIWTELVYNADFFRQNANSIFPRHIMKRRCLLRTFV